MRTWADWLECEHHTVGAGEWVEPSSRIQFQDNLFLESFFEAAGADEK